MTRREFLFASGAAVIPALAAGCIGSRKWDRTAYRKPARSRVAVLPAGSYDRPLADVVRRGIELFGPRVSGKTIVLKPNLVEYDPAGVINTHPEVIAAAIEAFRYLDAREVVVAEGPGHRRDTEYLLTASGFHPIFREYSARYVDLNYDDVRATALRSRFTGLRSLYLPETILRADLLVSMPKLKTHHWAGVTLSLKNMFGVVPGAVYGWPKNVLHWAGINESILDVNSSLSMPQFAIVDGIVGMEGNGPIQGDPRFCGVLVFGDDLAAVDATAARLMGIEPPRITHLRIADEFLGNVATERIVQIGEPVEQYRQDFRVLEPFQRLRLLMG